jgi:alpha-1,3-rhamnosyl/mannosyltransferase
MLGKPLGAAQRIYEAGGRETGGKSKPSAWRRLLGRTLKLARTAGSAALDHYLATASRLARWPLFHEPDAVPARVAAPTVTSVHDLSVLLYPHWHPPHRVRKYEKGFLAGVSRSKLFLTDAASTKADMVRLLGVPEDRIRVVELAPRPQFRELPDEAIANVRRRLSLPARFILYAGTIEPRKNVPGLLRAYAGLSPRLRSEFSLVLAGGWGWRSDDVKEMLATPPWSECVRWLGYLPDDDLVAVMNAAAVVVYPSYYEGFGLPPLEAMACGRPVVTTHCGSLREVVGEAAYIVEPSDDAAVTRALAEILSEPELAGDLIRRGREHVLKFDWARTARLTAKAYREAA